MGVVTGPAGPTTTAPTTPPRVVKFAGRDLTCTVRRSDRAKRITLRVLPGARLELVVPARVSTPPLEPLLRRHAVWIGRALDRVAARQVSSAGPVAGEMVPFEGRAYRLVVAPGHAARLAVALDHLAGTLTIALPAARCSPTDLADALERWYRARAGDALAERVAVRAADLGVSVGRLTIRDQRTRWGSCSSRGNLNFSWRIILAPPPVLDYLAVHELAHLAEPNHGPGFWALVERHCPAFRAHRAWLRQHGPDLMTRWR